MNPFNIIRLLDLISNSNIINLSNLENNIIPKSDNVWHHYFSAIFMEVTSTNTENTYTSIAYKSPNIQPPRYSVQKDAFKLPSNPYSRASLRPSITFVE